ncbi:GNAT family N-acetyltransferase [Streptomyces harbinensis]|uniref:GNAT family N-acetyltransferase n=1 Tax=Streptomyces harbinensis TaxID=1176198 RepID=UPI00371AEEAB
MTPMTAPQILHTAYLDPATRTELRALLDEAFDGEFTDEDWSHTLGGLHALIRAADGRIIGHGAVIQRRLLHGGQTIRTGYLEGVAVRAGHRGHGHGAALLTVLEDIVRRAYDLGALGSSEDARAFYAARGWRQWQGPTSVLTAEGPAPTADDDGGVYVLPVLPPADLPLDLGGALSCDWRDGDVW